MFVKNLTSPRTGNAVANQFIIRHEGNFYFQSYNSLCAVVDWSQGGDEVNAHYMDNVVTLGRDWDYSRTTMKYLNEFLREYASSVFDWFDMEVNASNIRKLIAQGVIRYNDSMR